MAIEEEETIEQAAAARRERLKALKAAQQLLENPEDDGAPDSDKPDGENGTDDEDNDVNVKFRNYLPHDKQLQEGKLAPPQLPKFEDPVASEPPVEEKKEDPFLNIAPKKPNWDLRRDVQKKLDKLEKRTQKAIFQVMEQQEKQKLLAEDGREDDSENSKTAF
uniref:coiled-coil domain-containing protein 12-like n=1 Tax=Erigeron canadensis TaxID=72917 RepID=UPI001CB99079|nr:coiled-coil domain-containing protein 12-like [Erigeron canadensis]XP_043634170.1 coiled-coil domain-containing protein 12-like [Erigeron canadensis]XP_043634171.1 coiled-coil domain-containing protein 12-like [Erigeron canadensis]